MKLNDDRYQWIYDNVERIKQAVAVADFCKHSRTIDDTFRKADALLCDLSFSFLMVAMGEHIPKTLWSVDDYSVLYGILDDAEELDMRDDG